MEDLTLISRVSARYAASSTLAKGDLLKVWIKKDDWWSEMRRGVVLEVKDVNGNDITVNHHGWATSGWVMQLPPGQDLSGKFKLDGNDKFRRSLIVERV